MSKYQEDILEEIDTTVDKENQKSLILYNDDIHTFDFVIEALIEVCKHTTEQAEQCTYLVHFKGKADVKQGSVTKLKPMREGLSNKGLKAIIE